MSLVLISLLETIYGFDDVVAFVDLFDLFDLFTFSNVQFFFTTCIINASGQLIMHVNDVHLDDNHEKTLPVYVNDDVQHVI